MMQKISVRSWTALPVLIASLVALSGCGTSSDSSSSQSYTVGGSVAGLAGGDGVELVDNQGGATLSVSADGPFTFEPGLAKGSTYAVTVSFQPEGQKCTVTDGSGTIRSANVTSVKVTCAAL
jgi:hypothetical protein